MQVAANTSTSAMKTATGVGTEDFLTLFIAQLKNQDPLNPQDPSQFVQQLATLTQVEQTYSVNTNLQKLQSTFNDSFNLGAVSLIGKTAKASSSSIYNDGVSNSSFNYGLSASTSETKLQIVDQAGRVVKNVSLGNLASGDHSYTWDGTDNAGKKVSAGTYSLAVSGTNAAGGTVNAVTSISGLVTGVRTEGDSTIITVSGTEIPIANLMGVTA